jgi:hypothetical protein
MFSMARFAFTLLICIVIVGIYLGWVSFHRVPTDPQSNNMDINLSLDKKKMGSDLRKFEQKVAKDIQDIDNQPQGDAKTPSSGKKPVAPGLNLGPISVQPSGQPAEPSNGQPASPQIPSQTEDYQFTVPLVTPPPGEGR